MFEGKPQTHGNPFTDLTESAVHSFIASLAETMVPKSHNSRTGRSLSVWEALLSANCTHHNRNCCIYIPFQPIRLKTHEKSEDFPYLLSRTNRTYNLLTEVQIPSVQPD
ncbi:MAG: hypothetical protein ACR2OJ_00190 [Hyphomicrobiales bacterium]